MTISSQQRRNGVIFILISALMFGSYGVWSKLIGDSFGVFYQGWTRALIICLILFPILLATKQIISIKKKDWTWMFVYLVFTSATQAPIFYAFNHMDIASASLLYFVTVLLTMYIIGFLFLHEKLARDKVLSFLFALLGLYLIFSFSLEKFTLLAASMAVLNGIASGGELAFSKKLSDFYPPLYLTFLSWFIIIPTNAVFSFLLSEKQLIPSFEIVWLWQMGYVIASLFGFWLVIKGLQYLESSIGGLIGLLEIVFSVVFGIVFFKEKLTIRVVLGALAIFIASSLPHLTELRKHQSTKHNKQ